MEMARVARGAAGRRAGPGTRRRRGEAGGRRARPCDPGCAPAGARARSALPSGTWGSPPFTAGHHPNQTRSDRGERSEPRAWASGGREPEPVSEATGPVLARHDARATGAEPRALSRAAKAPLPDRSPWPSLMKGPCPLPCVRQGGSRTLGTADDRPRGDPAARERRSTSMVAVGSRAGAVPDGPSPAPATSNGADGFPVRRSPAGFASRVM